VELKMYETSKEIEEREQELKERKRKKASIINTIILLIIIAGLYPRNLLRSNLSTIN